ncbi:MAG: cellulase family glycosylhydrolase [bacterium]
MENMFFISTFRIKHIRGQFLKIILSLVLLNTVAFSQKIKVACVGNSITYGYGLSNPSSESYPGQMQVLLGTTEYDVKNFGANARTMLKSGGYSYWDDQMYNNALASNPDYVVIELGTNDSKRWLWDSHSAEFKNDYREMVQSFQNLSSKPEIWIGLLIPGEKADWDIYNSYIKDKVNPKIKEVALEMGLGLIDLYSEFGSISSEWYQPDNVHPTVAGAEVIAQKVKEILLMPKPEVTLLNGKVTSMDGDDYQWYIDGIPVASDNGGQQKEMVVSKSGKYKVSIKLSADNETRIVSNELDVTLLPTAREIAGRMKVGWNMGNTLEAICGEIAWGGAYTTQKLIDSVKAAGFNAIRLPCAWFCHSDTVTSEIDAAWIARVKQVVDYCINDSLYVMLNIHWDSGWLENRVNAANQEKVNERQHAYWTQIANYFKDYDEHLLFAGANEPNVENAAQMAVLLTYHQTFIDAVRATGGNNSSRTLVIQGPSTDIDKTNNLMNTLPTDQIADRLIIEIHYYTPWQFCGLTQDANWGKMFYYWGKDYHSSTDVTRNATWGEESDVEKLFGYMKTKFIDKGIPVINGEYAAFRRKLNPPSDQALHDASIEYFHKYVVNSCVSKGIIPFYWDVNMGLFNRSTGAILDHGILNAIMEGAENATDISDDETNLEIPGKFRLEQNYPNPFNPSTVIGYQLPVSGFVSLKVFDILGREVDTLVNSYQNAGIYSVEFNASNLTNGVYFYRMDTGAYHNTKKLLVLK